MVKKNHQNDLPAWAEACKLVLLVQPSSAAAERVFSLLENSELLIRRLKNNGQHLQE